METDKIESCGNDKHSAFDAFLLAEYNNIAQAHFNTVDSISTFIKHYIILASVPISAVAVLLNVPASATSLLVQFLNGNLLPISIFLWTVTVLGLCVLAYIINIRLDALLYARTVNGLRAHFYGSSSLSLRDRLRISALPTSTSTPRYWEPSYFLPVVFAFAIVGTGYWSVGAYMFWHENQWGIDGTFFGVALAVFALHLLLYGWLTQFRERKYLRGLVIGVDIDGVLNDHRCHFATVLEERTGKKLLPDAITVIPVHRIPGIGITKADEEAVFNWAPYWTELPPISESVGASLQKIRQLGYPVWLFSHRDWPKSSKFPHGEMDQYWAEWSQHSVWSALTDTKVIGAIDRLLASLKFPTIAHGRLIRAVTTSWLKKIDVRFDRLVIEDGRVGLDGMFEHPTNRFACARAQKIRIFVEDDMNKAIRMAGLCEVVFLIDQPYNRSNRQSLPPNVVPVGSWDEIVDHVTSYL